MENQRIIRRISNRELYDLSENWENSKVSSDYYDNVMEAYEVDKEIFDQSKKDGILCQENDGHYYLGEVIDILDYLAS